MPIFPYLTLFLFSLSHNRIIILRWRSSSLATGPSRLGHCVEALPPGLRQPCPAHPRQAWPNPPKRHGHLLRCQEAPVYDPCYNHGWRHSRQQHLPSRLHHCQTKATSKSTSSGHTRVHPKVLWGWCNHPQVMQGVTGQPMGLPCTPVILDVFLKKKKKKKPNGGVFRNFCLSPLRIHTLTKLRNMNSCSILQSFILKNSYSFSWWNSQLANQTGQLLLFVYYIRICQVSVKLLCEHHTPNCPLYFLCDARTK
jgi:hypothetical protein